MFRGVFTPVITVFDKEGRLDFRGMEAMIEHLIDGGMNGLLFLGSIGEFFALTREEKEQLITFAVSKVNKRVPVLIGTGGTVVAEVVELTRFAESAGADGAVVISPYYFKLDEANLYRYYQQVAGAVQFPILLYNFPDRTAVNLSPQLVASLARDCSNIVGIKDTVDTISHTRQLIQAVKAVNPDFSVLSGFDEYLIPNLMAGGDGVICGLTNIVPELFSRLYADFQRGTLSSVQAAQGKISILMNLYDISQPFVAAIKGATALRGLPIQSVVRAPSIQVDAGQVEKMKDLFCKANIETTA